MLRQSILQFCRKWPAITNAISHQQRIQKLPITCQLLTKFAENLPMHVVHMSTAENLDLSTQRIENIIQEQLEPTILKVQDVSGGCGTSFSVLIVSDKFEGKPLIQRHRLVNDALKKEMKQIHALQMKTLTASEWESENSGG